MTTEKARGLAVDSGWVLAMILCILVPVAWWVVDHGNANQDRQQAQFRQQLETKFNQALSISSAQSAFSINKGVCGFRDLAQPQIDRAIKRRKVYPNLTAAERALNENAIKTGQQFLASQVTVPPAFDCRKLPKSGATP